MSQHWLQRLECKFPPPIFMLGAMGLSYVFARSVPLVSFEFEAQTGLALTICGLGLLFAAESVVRFIRRGATINPHMPNKSQVLVTGGLFRISRNPMYLGMLLLLTGMNIWLGALSSFISLPIFIWLVTHLQILPEERALERRFSSAYTSYCSRVGRWLWSV